MKLAVLCRYIAGCELPPVKLSSHLIKKDNFMSDAIPANIFPVILSGGSGTRLWPVSRKIYPKQLLPLIGNNSLLQDTVERASGIAAGGSRLTVVANNEHRFLIAEQCRALDCEVEIILEPIGRNTAPAATLAALSVTQNDPSGILLILPADHWIQDPGPLQRAVEAARSAVQAGAVAVFGIAPRSAETGYGYIKAGQELEGQPGVFEVERFVEKPNAETAAQYISRGGYFWNAGIYMVSAKTLLSELGRHAPRVVEVCRASWDNRHGDLDFIRLDEGAFAQSPDISLDYALAEKTDKAIVVPVELQWSDVGSWSALADVLPKDENGNTLIGDALAIASRNSFVHSPDHLTAVLGLDDAIVVTTEDAVLVTTRQHAQDVKFIVDVLKKSGRSEVNEHKKVYRPWGSYHSLQLDERFQVKLLTVTPGAKLSLQKHFHRAEHWVVVRGTAEVTLDSEKHIIRENQSIYIPLGSVHRIANPGKIPLDIIEVQTGSYLGEDDIVRLSDDYARS